MIKFLIGVIVGMIIDMAIAYYDHKDVIEVVRCGECKHMTANGRCREFADNFIRPSASDYCSYGERKDD